MSGWVCLHRSIVKWEWYDDINTSRLFIHCLVRANHCDAKWKGQDIRRGQFITSLDTLNKETGLTVSQIRTAFRKLESTGEIASLSQARSRMITVLKYDMYQSGDRLIASRVTGSSQADDRLMTTDNNVNNVNNENKGISEAQIDLEDLTGKPVQPKIKKYSERDYQFSEYMYSKILIVAPATKKPNFETWANLIRLMREADKREGKEIVNIFNWANADPFWSTNILSPKALRKQYGALHAKKMSPRSGAYVNSQQAAAQAARSTEKLESQDDLEF